MCLREKTEREAAVCGEQVEMEFSLTSKDKVSYVKTFQMRWGQFNEGFACVHSSPVQFFYSVKLHKEQSNHGGVCKVFVRITCAVSQNPRANNKKKYVLWNLQKHTQCN